VTATASELEMYTTEQLLSELFGRPTFVAAMMYSTTTHRQPGQSHADFKIRTTCDNVGTLELFERASDHFRTIVTDDQA
jgi:hypothetical protein